jgi:anti-sigma B factor antagonist
MPRTRSGERPPACAACGPLGLQVDIHPGAPAVAEVSGEIDIASASWLRETLLLAIRRHGPAINVDLRGVTFLDCSGISALLATARRARLEGGRMRVVRASAPARRVIRLLSLQDVLTSADDQAEAVTVPWQGARPA